MGSEVITYTIWIVVSIFLGFILFIVLKRNLKNRINQLFALAICCGIMSVIIDLVKSMTGISPDLLPPIINLLPLYFSCLGMAFLLPILFMLYKPEKMTNKNQALVALVYGGALAVIFLIPDGIQFRTVPGRTLPVTVYNLSLMIYMLGLLSCSIILIMFLYKQISIKFTDPDLSKRFKAFIMGAVLLHYSPFGICIVNYSNNFLNTSIVREIFSYTLFIMFVGIFLVYYGIGTGFKQKIPRT